MKLPILETYAFPVTLPSNNATLTIRPFLVKEEKLLLLAQESDDVREQIEAVAQVIRNCTNGQVDPNTSPYFDIEYLLVQLRARSVGEKITPIYQCHNKIMKDGAPVECGHKTPIDINLYDVKVDYNLDQDVSLMLPLSPRFTLYLRYPSIYTVNEFTLALSNTSADTSVDFVNRVTDIFYLLEDTETNTTYKFDDYSMEEKIEFLNSLRPDDYEKVLAFISALPTVKYTSTYTCEKCQFTHTISLSGLSDFLE